MADKGIPGLAGPEHIGITVPDIEAATDFFINVIGCQMAFDGGASGRDPDLMQTSLSVHRDAELKYCFLRCGLGANFEVFEYSAPDQNTTPPKNSDIGGHHVAFYVDDIEAAVAHLKHHGVQVQGEINHIEDGPAGGSAWVYFLAPWGLQLELVSYPKGKAYEAGAAVRLWHPGCPER